MVEETIAKEDLIAAVIQLTKSMSKEDLITKILSKMDTVDIKTIIQSVIDPMYEIKDQIYVSTERFTKTGKIQIVQQQKEQDALNELKKSVNVVEE